MTKVLHFTYDCSLCPLCYFENCAKSRDGFCCQRGVTEVDSLFGIRKQFDSDLMERATAATRLSIVHHGVLDWYWLSIHSRITPRADSVLFLRRAIIRVNLSLGESPYFRKCAIVKKYSESRYLFFYEFIRLIEICYIHERFHVAVKLCIIYLFRKKINHYCGKYYS